MAISFTPLPKNKASESSKISFTSKASTNPNAGVFQPVVKSSTVTAPEFGSEGSIFAAPSPMRSKGEVLKSTARDLVTSGNPASATGNVLGGAFELATGVRFGDFVREVANTLSSSQRGLGQTFGGALGESETFNKLPGTQGETLQKTQEKAQAGLDTAAKSLVDKIKSEIKLGRDTTRLRNAYKQLTGKQLPDLGEINPSINKTAGQVAGEALGVVLDIATAGTYGAAAKGAKTGQLLSSTAPSIVKGVGELATKTPGLFTAKGATNVAKGAGIGYGYDVSQGLQGGRGEDRTGTKALIPGAGTVIGGTLAAVPEAAQSVSNFRAKRAEAAKEQFNNLVGKMLQGTPDENAAAQKGLSNLDVTGVKKYKDLSTRANEKIADISTELDVALGTDATKRALPDLTISQKVGDQTIKHNFVQDALEQLHNFYVKTNSPTDAARIQMLLDTAEKDGLSISDLNHIAIEHGKKLSAYNANGELASGLSRQAAENTRMGLKGTAKQLFKNPIYDAADKEISALIRVRSMADDMNVEVNKLQQKIQPYTAGQKIGRMIFKTLDFASGGTLKGAVGAALPRGAGYKTLNALDLEAQLGKNLKLFNKLNEAGVGEDDVVRLLDSFILNQKTQSAALETSQLNTKSASTIAKNVPIVPTPKQVPGKASSVRTELGQYVDELKQMKKDGATIETFEALLKGEKENLGIPFQKNEVFANISTKDPINHVQALEKFMWDEFAKGGKKVTKKK